MSEAYEQRFFIIALLILYCILFYLILTKEQLVDFSSLLDSAGKALVEGENPYKNLMSTYLPHNKLLPANLNPPIVFLIFTPLMQLDYFTGLIFWLVVSLILGLIGISITFNYAFCSKFLQKYRINLYLFYLAFFGTLMNVVVLQLGSLLLFFIMLGYHFYLHDRDYFAGIFWGIIIAMKLFPALLFFYVLKQGRFKVFAVMIITVLMACLLPLLIYGPIIYKNYFSMLPNVLWYGDSWNASIYGFIFRLLPNDKTRDYLLLLEILYVILFFILLLFYLKKLGPTETNPINHQPFCLTLAMMLLMSPLGWVYFFPILIFPLILNFFVSLDKKTTLTKTMIIWILSFFLMNFPQDYLESKKMTFLLTQISYYSIHFYGLLLLVYLLGKRKKIYAHNGVQLNEAAYNYLPTLVIITAFGMSVPCIYFIFRLLQLKL